MAPETIRVAHLQALLVLKWCAPRREGYKRSISSILNHTCTRLPETLLSRLPSSTQPTCGTGWRSAQVQVVCPQKGTVAAVCQRRDDEAASVAQVLVAVHTLGVQHADLGQWAVGA